MSTIQSQVKKRIINKLNITGFVSLVKSSDLLRKLLVKMGLLEELTSDSFVPVTLRRNLIETPELIETNLSPDMIQVEFGNAIKIFNSLNNFDYYFYALKAHNDYRYYIKLKLYNTTEKFRFQNISESNYINTIEIPENKLFELELLKLYTGKDPPLS